MKEVTGNLWTYPADIRVITTNGSVKLNGQAVMGRGCALEATKLFPEIPQLLGKSLTDWGNVVHSFSLYKLMTFPVKHKWMEKADRQLIARSVQDFKRIILDSPRTYVMPRPGCGNGHLDWDDVRPLLECLPDNIAVITWK